MINIKHYTFQTGVFSEPFNGAKKGGYDLTLI